MVYSYDQILKRMEDKYTELTGCSPSMSGDIGIRMKLLAGEIFSLSTTIDWLNNQMFYTTASGKQLDMHAEQVGLHRIKGTKASGDLVLSLNVPVEYDTVIPAGSIFSTSDGALHYLTNADAVIQRGYSTAIVEADAEETGTVYNIPGRKVTTPVTYFSVGINVEGSSSFIGGTDDESDEQLRKRIQEKLGSISNGANAAYYKEIAENFEGVKSANVYQNTNSSRTVNVVIGGRGTVCSTDTVNALQHEMDIKKCAGTNVNVIAASSVTFSLNISIKVSTGHSFNSVRTAVQQAIIDYFYSLSVGEGLVMAELGSRIINVEGVENYTFNNGTDQSIDPNQMLVPGTLTISHMGV